VKSIRHNTKLVNNQQGWTPSQLKAVILEKHRIGGMDEIMILPTCSACGEIISDLEGANIEPLDGDPIPAGEIEGIPISVIPGPAYAFHIGCGPAFPIGPWKKLNEVIRYDQRWEGEKCLQPA
jgi:hypothetical protein